MPKRIQRRSDRPSAIGRNVLDHRRPPSRELGYDSHWQRVAQQRRHEDCYLCQLCLQTDRLTSSSDVDHIVPIHVRPDWRLEFDNTQVICRSHHRRKTILDARRYGSSTATTLTEGQRQARFAAQQLLHAPRSARGGPVEYRDVLPKIVSPPAHIPPRNWTPGGSA